MLRRNFRIAWCAAALACGFMSTSVAMSADPAEGFDCGYQSAEKTLATFRNAVEAGEVEDPATRALPLVHPGRYRGNPAVAGVPQVTADDIFAFEDSADILITNYTDGQRTGLMIQATNALLAAYGDEFDFVAFWLNFVPDHQLGAAFYSGIANDVSGIGLTMSNNRPQLGIAGDTVQGWVMMWNAANWGEGNAGAFTQLVLGQEFEHRFAMFIAPLSGGRSMQGNNGNCGRSGHWNFAADGQGSGMEIREWVGSNPAIRSGGSVSFNTDIGMASPITGAVFSYPDLYLMGYVSPEEMDAGASELRFLDDNTDCSTPYSGPISTWSSDDLIASNGLRIPDSTQAQKHFRTGWIMLHRPGAPPTSADRNHVVNILNEWTATYEWSTLGRGTMDNTLRAADCDNNNIPNACELDCGEPGGACDVPGCGTAADCNANGAPDNCEIDALSTAPGGPYFCRSGSRVPCDVDCNNNGVIDVCDSDCNANGIPDGCDFDCNENGLTDACENIADCNENGFADECDVAGFAYSASSIRLSPFGGTNPQSLELSDPPRAGSDLTLTFEASADLANSTEFVAVAVNGIEIGTVFGEGGQFCPVQPDSAQLTMSAELYNPSLVFRNVVISMTANPNVNAGICGGSFIKVTLEYEARYEDSNDSGVPDECENCTDDGDCSPPDLCSTYECVDGLCISTPLVFGDVAGSLGVCGPDGAVDLQDILAVLNGFAGEFADGCSLADIDIAPACNGDGEIGLGDILAVLDAFAGLDPCCGAQR